MDFRVLGPVEAYADGEPVRVGGPRQRTVLALLLHAAGRTVPADVLIDGVWGESAGPGARSTLQSYVFNLRAALGEQSVVTEGGGYRLAVDRDEIDSLRFEDALARAASLAEHSAVDAAVLLSDALAMWTGRPYSGLAPSSVIEAEARRLEELRLTALQRRIEAELAVGRHAELLPELEVLTTEFPLVERFWEQQMLALYRSGRQSEALRVYQKARRYFAEELGLDPSPQVQDLQRRVLDQDPDLDLASEPQVVTATVLMTDLDDAATLWEQHAELMVSLMRRHDEIVTTAVTAAGGRVFGQTGDGISAVFDNVTDAVRAAQAAQHRLAGETWGVVPVRVRMAVDTGDVEARDGEYFGPPVNRCARLLAAGHGGQVLLAEDAHAQMAASGGAGWQVRALGEHRFTGVSKAKPVFQLLMAGLDADFPPLRTDRTPTVLPSLGRSVRGFELRERVGGGAHGVVYRAYQPSVGREAAVKVIRPDFANQTEFVRRFETEAELVAQLEHPHIVPLYDYWRDPEGAYLVTRWLRGGSLRAALDDNPWDARRAAAMLRQVGGALTHAHRHGIIHHDLKPANILLDEDGNAYVADFGIAVRPAADHVTTPSSSPAYLAPEVLRGDPISVRTDIYALGLVLFETVSGQRAPMDGPLPRLTNLRPELPAALDAVVAQACADDPAERYGSVGVMVAAVAEASGSSAAPDGDVVVDVRSLARNPYKGLHAFQESDAPDFFGRTRTVEELVEAVAGQHLVAVVGPSGIGKSSVVRAGVMPRLRADGWLVTDMVPGAFPFDELAGAIQRVAIRSSLGLTDDLAAGGTALVEVARQVLPPGSRVLLVIDQFEELFTLTAEEDVRRRFLDSLTALGEDDASPISVLGTLRADFLDRPLRYPELGELLTAGTVMLAAPGRDELADAIRRPAENVGVRFESGLVERIATEVMDQPGGLPLLQYALTELFEGRSSDVITAADYERSGGVLSALRGRAEELFAQLDAAGQEAARQSFLRLVTVSEAAQDTRRRVPRRELRGLPLDSAALEEVLDRFGSHRLLTFDRHPVTRAPTVEVAHEALLTRWDRLLGWIDDRREALLLHRRLADSVDEWERSDRDADYLLGGGRLVQFETLTSTDLALSETERKYLNTSRTAAERELTRRRRLRRALVGGLAVGLVITTFLAAIAFVNQRRADQEADVARARELAAAAIAVLGDDPALSKLLAVASASDGEMTTESVAALHQAWAADRVTARIEGPPFDLGPLHADIHPSGHRAVVAGWGELEHGWNYLELLDIHTSQVLWTFEPEYNSAVPSRPRFSPDGTQVATGVAWASRPWEGPEPPPDSVGAFVLDTATGEVEHRYDLGRCGGFVDGVSDTHLLVKTLHGQAEQTCDWFGNTAVELVDRLSGERHLLVAGGNRWSGAALSGDGRFVAFDDLDTGGVLVMDVSTGETILDLESRQRFVRAINHDGSLLVNGDDPIDVWDIAAGEVIASYTGHEGDSFFATFDPSGSSVYSTGEDGNLHHWDATTGVAIAVYPSVGHFNTSATGHGDVLVTRQDWTVALVDTGIRGELGAIETCPGSVLRDSLAVTGRTAVMAVRCDGDEAATTHVVDLDAHDVRYTLPGHGAQALSVSPDGTQFARQEADGSMLGTITIRDLETGALLVELDGLCTYDDASIAALDDKAGCRPHAEPPFALWADRLRWSPDGSMIASASRGGAVVWDAATGNLLFTEDIPKRPQLGLALGSYAFDVIFSADSRRLIASGDADLRVLATDTWEYEQTAVNNTVGGYSFGFLGFSPDGSTLLGEGRANGDPLGTLTWLDPETLDWVREVFPTHEAGVSARAVSPDRSLVATGAADGLVRVWDAVTGGLVHEVPFGRARVAGVAFTGDSHLAVMLDGGGLQLITIDPAELLEIVHSSLTRGFTDAECERFGFSEHCPTLAELRGPAPGFDDPGVLNGEFQVDWTPDGLVDALIRTYPDEELTVEFAEIAWAEAHSLQRPGSHTLRFAEGRWDHAVTADDVTWVCIGTYNVSGDRVELTAERGICDPSRVFNSEFELTDGQLRFVDYTGRPLERVVYTAEPWQRID